VRPKYATNRVLSWHFLLNVEFQWIFDLVGKLIARFANVEPTRGDPGFTGKLGFELACQHASSPNLAARNNVVAHGLMIFEAHHAIAWR
jgi:hypothetical protein